MGWWKKGSDDAAQNKGARNDFENHQDRDRYNAGRKHEQQRQQEQQQRQQNEKKR